MASVLSDPALHTFTGGTPSTVDELRSRYARMVAGPSDPGVSWCNWVLVLGEGGSRRLTGTVQVTIGPGRRGLLAAEIAWVVGTPWQGRGIATEAARGLVRWLDARGVGVLIAHIHPDHAASAAVAGAVGLAPTDARQDGETRWERSSR
ncbi:GNAT family N-acetyltransferase [Streptomyces sp. NPDC051569]|uniref:GNAT family N-acetyltransferase n=1 Tax=Streptomyces sp. NPDC051569 TaxID=3365661 RepID=UPI0037BE1FEE